MTRIDHFWAGSLQSGDIIQDGGRTWDGEKDFKMGTEVFGQYHKAHGMLVDETKGGVLKADIIDSSLGFSLSGSLCRILDTS